MPPRLADGFETAHVARVGGNTALVDALIAYTRAGRFGKQNSLLVVKEGKLVVVLTAENFRKRVSDNRQMQGFIIPAFSRTAPGQR